MSTSWTIDNTRCNSKSLRIIDPSTGYAVADVFAHERLIAAAPDMAEALRALLGAASTAGATGVFGTDGIRLLHLAMSDARAALAKAGL